MRGYGLPWDVQLLGACDSRVVSSALTNGPGTHLVALGPNLGLIAFASVRVRFPDPRAKENSLRREGVQRSEGRLGRLESGAIRVPSGLPGKEGSLD